MKKERLERWRISIEKKLVNGRKVHAQIQERIDNINPDEVSDVGAAIMGLHWNLFMVEDLVEKCERLHARIVKSCKAL